MAELDAGRSVLALRTEHLGRRYGKVWGLRDCSLEVPAGAVARAPLLVLDEPVSSLDPIARLEFMRDVMATAADSSLTFLISSHVVSELERFCDWLIVLAHGHVQLAGPSDDLLDAHRLLTVPRGTQDDDLPGT